MSFAAPTISNQHKRIIRQLYEEVWTNADFSNISSLVGPQYTCHFRGETIVQGPEDLIRIVTGWKEAFPDLRFDVEGIAAERDLAAVRVVRRGTQEKAWKGIPATGRTAEVHEMIFFRFEDGRIVEAWEVADEYALRQQLIGAQE